MKLGTDATEEQRGRFAHPNIVPIYDLGADDAGSPFYTMKLVKGRTLQAILKDLRDGTPDAAKQHTLGRLLGIFRKVCDAIAFAHSKGVLHRDLNPENIMVGEFGDLVMDWGLAKFLRGEQVAWNGEALSPWMVEQSRVSSIHSGLHDRRRPHGRAAIHEPGAGGGKDHGSGRALGRLFTGGHPLRHPYTASTSGGQNRWGSAHEDFRRADCSTIDLRFEEREQGRAFQKGRGARCALAETNLQAALSAGAKPTPPLVKHFTNSACPVSCGF
jgi:serine/threonine protein kinase